MDLLKISRAVDPKNELMSYLANSFRATEHITSIGIGRAIGYSHPITLAKSESETYAGYFRSKYLISAREKVSELNEVILVDHEAIIRYAQKFYAIRCENAHSDGSLANDFLDPIARLTNVSVHLSQDDIAIIRDDFANLIKINQLALDWYKK